MKRYKPRLFKTVISLITGLFAVLFIGFILSRFIVDTTYGVIILALIYLFFAYSTILQNKITIIVDNDKLILEKGKKEEVFPFNEYEFSYYEVNGSKSLIVTDEAGKQEEIDCDLLSYKDYESLLEDLCLIGDNQRVIKIKTKRKGE